MPPLSHPDLRRQIKARLLALPPRAFELLSGDLLHFMGLRDVSVTRYVGDGGLDAVGRLETSIPLISIPTGVQVKRYQANVQRADIDRFIGALHGRYSQGIFITTAGYTPQAMQKADAGIPRVATVNGEQVVALMLRHSLGVMEMDGAPGKLDEEYFGQFEAQATARLSRVNERPEAYQVRAQVDGGLLARPEDDLISLRALSHALRIDTSVPRRWIEKGMLRPDLSGAQGGYLFRRDRIETIRAELLGRARPANPDAWRHEFLDFARSRNMSKSYKPVLLKTLIKVVDRNGETHIDALVDEFRAFYLARRQAGLVVEFGPPDLTDTRAVSDAQLRQLIVKNPLERFLIKGFLEYLPKESTVRFAPQLWHELRAWELLDIQKSADEQLGYYYGRPRRVC
jgi:restriction endonuclease